MNALLLGLFVGAAFPEGTLATWLNRWGHTGFATVMAVGSGLLLAAALTDLAPHAVEGLGLAAALGLMLCV